VEPYETIAMTGRCCLTQLVMQAQMVVGSGEIVGVPPIGTGSGPRCPSRCLLMRCATVGWDPPGHKDLGVTSQEKVTFMPGNSSDLREFRVAVPQSTIHQITSRVAQYPHFPPPDDEGDTWDYGVNSTWLRELCDYWVTAYDWRKAEAELNRYPQFLVTIGEIDLHFVQIHGETNGTRPLLLLHGWPGSHYEFWEIADRLAFPSRYGGSSEDAFDLVIPSLPGYGFSGAPKKPIGPRTTASLMDQLMTDVLGHDRYMVQGGDWGAVVGSWIGCDHSARCTALHVNLIGWRPSAQNSGAVGAEETQSIHAIVERERPHLAYALQQSTRPQTLGLALHDSPVGTAVWILDRFHDWSDLTDRSIDDVYSHDALLTNVMIYLVTGSVATSLWAYRGNALEPALFSEGIRCITPTAVARFPFEYVGSTPPRSWVERHYNLARWTEMPSGGHFAALERPEYLLKDVQEFGRDAYPTGH
jgi:pimeloyl-ACP methyl ester carboxylesterase